MKKKLGPTDQKRQRKSVNFMIDDDEFLAHQNQSLGRPPVALENLDNLLNDDSNHSDEAPK